MTFGQIGGTEQNGLVNNFSVENDCVAFQNQGAMAYLRKEESDA